MLNFNDIQTEIVNEMMEIVDDIIEPTTEEIEDIITDNHNNTLFYRYDDMKFLYSESNWECRIFISVKKTPKGHWIKELKPYDVKKKWIPDVSRKRYAYPTKEEALYSYYKRKIAQKSILKHQYNTALNLVRKLNKHYDSNKGFIKERDMEI